MPSFPPLNSEKVFLVEARTWNHSEWGRSCVEPAVYTVSHKPLLCVVRTSDWGLTLKNKATECEKQVLCYREILQVQF